MYFRPIRLFKCLIILILFIILYNFIDNFLWNSNIEFVSKGAKVLKPSTEAKALIPPTEAKVSIPSTLGSTDEFNEISHILEPFTTYLPNFPDDEARNWFLNSTYYQMYSKQCSNKSCDKNGFLFDNLNEHRHVHVALVKNGLYLNDDCGYRYGDQAIRRTFNSTDETSVIYDKAIIYVVPDGWSFQHFLDGIGPKLSHSRIYLNKYPDAKVIIQKGMRLDQSVKEIWALLGVEESNHRLIHYQNHMRLGARLLINPCRTPATHPKLWHDARQIYWSLANLSQSDPILSRNKLIYIQRTPSNSKNAGRFILNEEPLIEIFREYAIKSSLTFVLYDHSKESSNIGKQIALFYQARIIIGVHGGAQSNMNFAQPNTTIIEIMPYRSEQSTVPIVCKLSTPDELKPCVGYIYYTQSQLLNHSYWILPTPVNADGNLNVNVTRVKRLFNSLS